VQVSFVKPAISTVLGKKGLSPLQSPSQDKLSKGKPSRKTTPRSAQASSAETPSIGLPLMMVLNRWRIFLVLGLSLLGLLCSIPPFLPAHIQLPSWIPQKRLVLGLDLQGGAHLLLEVDQKKLLEDRASLLLDSTRKALRAEKIGYVNLSPLPQGVKFDLREEARSVGLNKILTPLERGLVVSVSGTRVTVTFDPQAIQEMTSQAVDKSMETIRRRVDETGTKEPVIQRQGQGRIILQVPGFDDPQRLKELIGKTARLSFQLVDQMVSSSEATSFPVPPGKELLPAHKNEGGRAFFYLVDREVLLSGDMLVDAHPAADEFGRAEVAFKFNHLGAERFARVTREHVGRQFAIILDGEVASAPQIKQPILGGAGVIQGSFTIQQTQDLSLLMRSGALPAPLIILEERTVGPGLGADSIHQGTQATVFAIVAVTAFMFLAYSFRAILNRVDILTF
jgi:preprotein translocase subunit SecD